VILKEFPNAVILDVRSKGLMCKLSPKYGWKDIPVPGCDGETSLSVDGIWQGLKVMRNSGVNKRYFKKDMMVEKERGGEVKGYRFGGEKELLSEAEARKMILVPAYEWVLENRCGKLMKVLKKISEERTVVLLDGSVNDDIENVSEPFSIASVIKNHLEG
jgi:hypothetical protein